MGASRSTTSRSKTWPTSARKRCSSSSRSSTTAGRANNPGRRGAASARRTTAMSGAAGAGSARRAASPMRTSAAAVAPAWMRSGGGAAPAWACVAVALAATFFPVVQLASSALVDARESIAWISIWTNGTLAIAMAQTALVCAVAAAVTIAASAPQAAAVSLFEFKGARAVELATLAPMLIAPYVAAGAWAGLDLGFFGSQWETLVAILKRANIGIVAAFVLVVFILW